MVYKSYQNFKLTLVWMLIVANLLPFIATTLAPKLIFFFGLQPASFSSRPWTLLTSLFIHAGLWHIAVNMLTLYFFGTHLTRLIGDKKFLTVYFGGGILGSIFFIFLAPPLATAIGASGAIFALGGTLAVLQPRLPVLIFPIPAPIPLWAAVIGGFFVLTLISPLFHIAWQAHLGGLIFGLTAGYFFKKRQRYSF